MIKESNETNITVKELEDGIYSAYNKYFPDSDIDIIWQNLDSYVYNARMLIKCYLGKKSDNGGNNLFKVSLLVNYFDGVRPQDMCGNTLILKINYAMIAWKTVLKSGGHGNGAEILKRIDSCFKKLYKTVITEYKNGSIPEQYIDDVEQYVNV